MFCSVLLRTIQMLRLQKGYHTIPILFAIFSHNFYVKITLLGKDNKIELLGSKVKMLRYLGRPAQVSSVCLLWPFSAEGVVRAEEKSMSCNGKASLSPSQGYKSSSRLLFHVAEKEAFPFWWMTTELHLPIFIWYLYLIKITH